METASQLRRPRAVDNGNSPPNYDQLTAALSASRAMLAWEDDWDGAGSPGYAESTWEQANRFVVQGTLGLWRDWRVAAPVPEVGPGPQGTIDILWQAAHYRLLLNVKVDAAQPATFYGENGRGETIEGSLDLTAEKRWLWLWMLD